MTKEYDKVKPINGPRVQHVVYLTIGEEQRFVNMILKKYGRAHGNVAYILREAVMKWVKEMEGEA